MEKDHYVLELPKKLVELLQVQEDSDVEIIVKDEKAYFELKKEHKEEQGMPLQWVLLPALLAGICFVGYFFFLGKEQIGLTGAKSIASMVIYLGLVSGIISFIVTFTKGKKHELATKSKDIYWRNFPAVLLSFSIILFLGLVIFFKIMGLMFKGVSFDLVTSTVLFFVLVSIVNYVMVYVARSITPPFLIHILTGVIIGGILIAMVTNRDYQWWQYNFSFLGTGDAKNRWEFNLTLILSAVLMIALVDYLFVNLKKSFPANKRLFVLRVLLLLTAINLGGVGAFPYSKGVSGVIHNQVAANLVYLIVILIVSIRWLLPYAAKEFLLVSYVIGGILIVSCILFQGIHYLSLTAFELISFMLAFSWLLLLLQYLQTLSNSQNDHFTARITGYEAESLLEE